MDALSASVMFRINAMICVPSSIMLRVLVLLPAQLQLMLLLFRSVGQSWLSLRHFGSSWYYYLSPPARLPYRGGWSVSGLARALRVGRSVGAPHSIGIGCGGWPPV